MEITAALVKDLRERTGLGMMECKKALQETKGDMNAAVEYLRKKAGARVEKRAGRTAAEGVIGIYVSPDRKIAAMVEVNSETDFVARQEQFTEFAKFVVTRVAEENPGDAESLLTMSLKNGAGTVAQAREELITKLGENINVRRFIRYTAESGLIGSYVHSNSKIGVLVEMQSGNETLARDVAMHIAASRPEYVSNEEVPDEVIAKEKEIFVSQAAESGKPVDIIEKMVVGRVNKYLNEISLLGQPFVKDLNMSIDKLLKSADAKVIRFCRYQVGEGIDKGPNDFAAEVMAQVKGG